MVTVDTSKQELSQAYSATDNSTRNLSNYSPNNNTLSPVITNPINISLSQNDSQSDGRGLSSIGSNNIPIIPTLASATGGYAGGCLMNYNPGMSAAISGASYLAGDQIANYYNGSYLIPNPYDRYEPPAALPSSGKNQIITFVASTAIGAGIMSYLGSPIEECIGISLLSSAAGIAADYLSTSSY